MTTAMQIPAKPSRLIAGERLSLGALLGLNLLYVITSLQQSEILWTLLLVPCFSLLIFVPGIVKQHPRSYNWLCFVILIHFTVGVTNAMAPSSAWNDYVQTLLSVTLFISAMMTSRWLQAWQLSTNEMAADTQSAPPQS